MMEMSRWSWLSRGQAIRHARWALLSCLWPYHFAAAQNAQGVRLTAGADYRLDAETRASFAFLYLGDIDAAGGIVTIDRRIGPNWGLQAGYALLHRSQRGAPDLNDHFLRAGATYRRDFGDFSFDDRLLYEMVVSGEGRRDGARLRNRARLTYRIARSASLAPRLFASLEPVLDNRAQGLARVDYALGAGATIAGEWSAEIGWLRQDLTGRGDRNALQIQLLYRPTSSHGEPR